MQEGHVHSDFKGFLKGRLLQLIAGKARLHVILSTYNHVTDFENGPYNTGQEGLTLHVQAGGFAPSLPALMMASMLGSGGGEFLDAVNGYESRTALAEVESHMGAVAAPAMQNAVPILAFVYYGLSAGSKPLDTARRLHREFGATVVLVACDCGAHGKQLEVGPLVDAGDVADLVFGNRCGCRDEMHDIAMTIIAGWPTRSGGS